MNKIGVGIIGASPLGGGWAVKAHVPAIQVLPDYELHAVSTSRRESAEAAATAFGVAAFDNHRDLIAFPGVDLVVVTVKVTEHHALVSAALEAGKMVLSEWPLGINLDEAIDLDARARKVGVRTAIGLQGRYSPAVAHARDLIAGGYVGEVLATTLVGSGIAWAGETDRAHAYMFNRSNGATLLSVPLLHALDALHHVLGEFASVSASVAIRRPTIRLVEDGSSIRATAPDHVAVSGTLESGAVASVFYRGGVSRGENLRWEINGSEGDLVLSSEVGNLQIADLTLRGGRGAERTATPVAMPPSYAEAPGGLSGDVGANVLRLYAALAKDIRDGTHHVPGFAHAVRRHRLLTSIEEAARSGVARKVG
jgi:predicted dehydrogenase